MPAARPGFLGRTRERDVLDGLLANVREGQSDILVIRGEAGIGKTALLRYAARQAAGFRVAQITGVEAEMELPFAGTHQLCAPMLGRLDALPRPQRDALRVALGVATGDAPDRFLVGVAVLGLLSAVAEERPLLCLVEDAQWLDAASSQVLGFVARRVLAESVAIVVAVRGVGRSASDPPTRDFDGLPELRLDGLRENDARALLAAVVPGRLDDRIRDRIVAETRGNPLALLELPGHTTAAELAGGFELPAAGDVQGHIEDHYLRRVGALPEATQRLSSVEQMLMSDATATLAFMLDRTKRLIEGLVVYPENLRKNLNRPAGSGRARAFFSRWCTRVWRGKARTFSCNAMRCVRSPARLRSAICCAPTRTFVRISARTRSIDSSISITRSLTANQSSSVCSHFRAYEASRQTRHRTRPP